MKSTKFFNNISDKLRKEIKRLEKNEVVTFQMLNGVPNPEPDERERSKAPILYGKHQLQTNFRIYDPYQQDSEGNEVGGYVDVGCVDAWNGEYPVRFRHFVPGQGEYTQFGGKFSLHAGNIKDVELFEILWLSNEREGNPHRDESVKPLFKILDLKADTKQTVSKVERLKKALEIADKMTVAEAKELMAALNQPTYDDNEVLIGKLKELASEKYDIFLNTYNDPAAKTKAVIKTAMDAGVVDFDLATGAVTVDKQNITTLKSKTFDDFVADFSQFVEVADNGKQILANIKKQLKAAQK